MSLPQHWTCIAGLLIGLACFGFAFWLTFIEGPRRRRGPP